MEEKAVKKNTKTKSTVKESKPKVSFSAKVYDMRGQETGTFSLPENVFGERWNADLVHQVVVSMESNKRTNVAHTKNRGEVSGGGKKPWQQKGTGRARHGSTRSPIWRHGGVTHGPRNDKLFDKKINKKMKAKALYAVLSAKYRDGQIIFVDDLSLKVTKTKEARSVLVSLSKVSGFTDLISRRNNSAYITIPSKDVNTEKSFKNFGNVLMDEIRNINPLNLLKYKYLVITNPEKGIPQIEGKLGSVKVKNLKV